MLNYRQVPNLSQTNLNEIYASQTASIERGGHPDMEFLHSARHPTKANTAKALVVPGDFPALWLDGFSLKPANHHSTPNLGHQALLISCGLHGHRRKKKSQ